MGTIEGTSIEGARTRTWRFAGAPVDGTSGTLADVAEKGDLLVDTTNADLYQNTNTQASPTWTQISGAGLAQGVVGEMAAAGTAAANVIGTTAKYTPVDHVHALGDHDHTAGGAGAQIGPGAFASDAFGADAAGRAPFTDGIWQTAKLAAGILSADTAGRALMVSSFFNAAKAADAFADSSIPGAKVNFSFGVAPTTILPDASAAEGSSGSVARADHAHAIAAGAPSATNSLGAAAAEGSSNNFLRADAVLLARVANDVFFLGRNAANGADINAWKINASDQIEFGANVAAFTMAATLTVAAQQISFSTGNVTFSGAGYVSIGASPADAGSIRLPNDTFALSARNQAGGGNVDIVKINASDQLEFGANLAAFTMGGTLTMAAQQISFSTGNVTFSGAGYISIGASPADAGSIRLPNDTAAWTARDQAGGGNVSGWKINATDDYEAAADVNLAGNTLYGATAANGNLVLSATAHATVTTAYVVPSNLFDASTEGLATRVKAGAVGDGEVSQTDVNGMIAIDSTNGRLYFRYGAAWHYAAQTAGIQIPADEIVDPDGYQMRPGDEIVAVVDRIMDDGALHAVWKLRNG